MNSDQVNSRSLPVADLPDLAARAVNWLYLPPGYTDLMMRLTGICTIMVGVHVCFWANGGPGPFSVPAWRWYYQLLTLPNPGLTANIVIFTIAAACCLAITFGIKRKWVIAVPTAVLAYYGSRDLMGLGAHFVIIDLCLLVAFLFARPGPNCTRRIIQTCVVTCYFFAALQKLTFAEFMQGYSLQAYFATAEFFNDFWKPLLHLGLLPMIFWQISAWLVVLTEFSLAFGLMIKPLRRAALILAVILHLGFFVFLPIWIMLFQCLMLTTLLAFLDKKNEPSAAEEAAPLTLQQHNRRDALLAAVVILSIVAVPTRFYVPLQTLNSLTFHDRGPWSWCMYLMCMSSGKNELRYKEYDQWHDIAISARLGHCSSDNDMLEMCQWAFDTHPSASEATASTESIVNHHWLQKKFLHATRDHADPIKVETLPDLGTDVH